MRKIILLFPVVFMLFFTARCAPGKDKGIVFNEASWQEVLNKARETHKLIFLDIYASWCGPCKMLRKQTFTDKKVGDYFNSNFINASFDGEVGDGIKLAEKLNVTAYPSLYLIDGDGKVVSISVGYLTAKDLLRFAKGAAGN